MKETFRRYPIGIQNFEDLRNNDCVYIDKTALIYHLTHTNKIYFLSRPRRFGKSLLVSTLEAYFSGRRLPVPWGLASQGRPALCHPGALPHVRRGYPLRPDSRALLRGQRRRLRSLRVYPQPL